MTGAEPLRVVFLGDSICFGQGVSLHRGWVTRISARLEALGAEFGRRAVVVNASINGNTTRQALERMPYDVQAHGVDVLITQFGMNDCNHWLTDRGLPRVSLDAFEANLHEIITRARTFGAKAVLLNTNHPTGRDQELMEHCSVSYEESNRRYNAVIRRVAATYSEEVQLNDMERFFDQWTGGERGQLLTLLLEDMLHPSEDGHDLYYEVVCPEVERAVRRLVGAEAGSH